MRCEVVNDVFVRMFWEFKARVLGFFFPFFIFFFSFLFLFLLLLSFVVWWKLRNSSMGIIQLKRNEYWLNVCTVVHRRESKVIMNLLCYIRLLWLCYGFIGIVERRRVLTANILICNWFCFLFVVFVIIFVVGGPEINVCSFGRHSVVWGYVRVKMNFETLVAQSFTIFYIVLDEIKWFIYQLGKCCREAPVTH